MASAEFTDLILETMVQGSGSLIYETGRGYTTRAQGKPPYKFKYVNVWVRANRTVSTNWTSISTMVCRNFDR